RTRRGLLLVVVRHRHVALVALVRVRAILAGFYGANLPLHRAFGGGLQIEIERRVDLEPLLVELLAELLIELLANPLDVVWCELSSLDLGRKLERIRLRFARLLRRDHV